MQKPEKTCDGNADVEGTRWCADHIDEWTILRHSTGDND